MKRYGQRIRVRPDRIDDYERLHAEAWPGVLEQIRRSNIRNYSIFRHGTDLFAYFEYVGDDFEGDMAAMAADLTIAQVDAVVPTGSIDPQHVHIPGAVVDRVVVVTTPVAAGPAAQETR